MSEPVAGQVPATVESGDPRPGDRRPTEAQMGVVSAVSPPPRREARPRILKLAADGHPFPARSPADPDRVSSFTKVEIQ